MFQINGKVLCVETHPDRLVVKGKIYTVYGLKRGCYCHPIIVDVGFSDGIGTQCKVCGKDYSEDVLWFNSTRFIPLNPDTELSETTVDTILEQVKTEV